MVEKVFLGLDCSSRDKLIDYPYVLISAASLWNGKRFKKIHFNDEVKEIFLDSGGFSFFTKWAKYPFTTDQYLEMVRAFCEEHPRTRYVSVMDYPCEPLINRSDLRTNYQRIDETLKNTEALYHREIPSADWVSVIQGHNMEEYSYCSEEFRKRGLWTPLTAVGSICTRNETFAIKQILFMLSRKHRDVKLHAFGLDYRVLKDREIWNLIYSSDSGAWRLCGDGNKRKKDWRPRGNVELLESYKRYREKIDALFDIRNGNGELCDFKGCIG